MWILHPKKKCPVIRYTDIHLPDPGVSRWEVMIWGLILGTCIYLHYQFSQLISDSEMRTHSIIQKLCYERQNCILPIVDLRYQVLKLLASASCFLNGNVSCGHIVPTHSPCVFWRFTGCATRHASPVTAIHSHGGGSLQLWIDIYSHDTDISLRTIRLKETFLLRKQTPVISKSGTWWVAFIAWAMGRNNVTFFSFHFQFQNLQI